MVGHAQRNHDRHLRGARLARRLGFHLQIGQRQFARRLGPCRGAVERDRGGRRGRGRLGPGDNHLGGNGRFEQPLAPGHGEERQHRAVPGRRFLLRASRGRVRQHHRRCLRQRDRFRLCARQPSQLLQPGPHRRLLRLQPRLVRRRLRPGHRSRQQYERGDRLEPDRGAGGRGAGFQSFSPRGTVGRFLRRRARADRSRAIRRRAGPHVGIGVLDRPVAGMDQAAFGVAIGRRRGAPPGNRSRRTATRSGPGRRR